MMKPHGQPPSITLAPLHPLPPLSYELLYKQAVGTHDAFLGMSGKDPSSACCEELVLRIALPEAAGAAGAARRATCSGNRRGCC